MEAQVKHFVFLKLAVVGFGIGAALLLTPACRAQSEISPDHFDGTDSWAVAARTVHTAKQKLPAAKPSLQAKSRKAAPGPTLQMASARETSKPVNGETGAVDRKRKPASDKPEKQ